MTANSEFVDFITEQLAPMGPLAAGRFFGGHAFKSGDVQFAMIMGNTLYLRVDDKTRPAFEDRGAQPFSYGKKTRLVAVKTNYAAPEELLDEPDELVVWARRALDAAIRSPTGSGARIRK
ncbi:MAG: TfoX/Sxy family protein [Alphaproteobacteria bacterium]